MDGIKNMAETPNETPLAPKKNKFIHMWPLVVIAAGIIGFFALGGDQYLSFETLSQNRQTILDWTAEHYLVSVLIFVVVYHLVTMFSIPGAVWLSLGGGFVYGAVEGTVYIVLGATSGAVAIFLLAKYAMYDFFRAKVGKKLHKMEAGFREDAFNYMLVLRLLPIMPFWVVNLVPALLGVRVSVYGFATLIGIIPGAFVYASVGSGLGVIFDRGDTPDLGVIFEPQVLLPLIGLSVLSLLPVIYKKYRKTKKGTAP